MRFIRRHGRIIPIKEKGELAAPAKALAGGLLVAHGGSKLSHITAIKDKKMTFRAFSSRYSDFIKKAGDPFFAHHDTPSAAFSVNAKKFSALNKPLVYAGKKARTEAILLHEVGHLKASRQVFTANRFLRRNNVMMLKYLKKGQNTKLGALGIFNKISNPFVNLVSEAEASGHALKAAHQSGGLKKVGKIGSRLAIPYLSYVGAAVAAGGALALGYKVGKIIKNRFNKK